MLLRFIDKSNFRYLVLLDLICRLIDKFLLPYLMRCDWLLLNRHFHYLNLLLRHDLVWFTIIHYLCEELLEQLLLHDVILDENVLVLRITFICVAASQVLTEVATVFNGAAVVNAVIAVQVLELIVPWLLWARLESD
jgi:hypothetical protein